MTSASDDGAVIKCRASHPALVTGAIYPHLEDAVNLTIYCKNTYQKSPFYPNLINAPGID